MARITYKADLHYKMQPELLACITIGYKNNFCHYKHGSYNQSWL